MTGDDEVGSVADEAAKLLAALQDWAKDAGVGHTGAAAGFASTLAAGARDVNEHIATGGADCLYCPVCRAIDLVRQTSPEVKAHLTVAASSLLQAVAVVLETHVPKEPPSRMERIDLDDAQGPDWD